MAASARRQKEATTADRIETWVREQYTSMLIVMTILVIIIHPAFHFILELVPNIPPDSLGVRLFAAGVAAVCLVLVLAYPPARRWSAWLSIVNAATALSVTHLVVLDSGNSPIYLATALTAVYGAQLSYIRLREWLITVAVVWTYYIYTSVMRNQFATLEGWVPPLYFLTNYVIASALIGVRAQLQYREMQGRIALQHTNDEMTLVTEQLHSELVLARNIQQSLLPPAVRAWPRLNIVCASQPAREVGGDFYTYHRFEDGRICLAVGDVSGKGVSAALLMASSLSLVNSHLERHLAPAELVAELDRSLQPYMQPRGQNCALCYLEFDGYRCVIVNAGGIPPYIRHQNGTIDWPDVRGFALGHGLGADSGYRSMEITVEPGDMLVIISDGVVEAMDTEGHMFGFDRLERCIQAGPGDNAQAMLDHLRDELERFVGHTEAHDDLTLLVARIHELRRPD